MSEWFSILILFWLGHRLGGGLQVPVELDKVLGRADGDLLEDVPGLAWPEGGVKKVVDGVWLADLC